MLHRHILPADNHGIISWFVADPTALAALSLVATDIGKVAVQASPGAILVLLDDTVPTWVNLIGGGGGGSDDAADINVVDAGGFYTGTNVEDILQEIGASLDELFELSTQQIAIVVSDEATALTQELQK